MLSLHRATILMPVRRFVTEENLRSQNVLLVIEIVATSKLNITFDTDVLHM